MLNKIISTIPKITHQVYFLDIIINHVKNIEQKKKWEFTFKTFNNLLESIDLYNSGNHTSVILNYIINDYETLSKMIDEFKEDIYDKVNPQCFMLLDKLSIDEFKSLKAYENDILAKYELFSKYTTKYLLYELEDIKSFGKKVIGFIEQEQIIINKNLPYDKLANILKLHILDINTLIKIYNIFTTSMKNLDSDIFNDEYQKLKFDTIIAVIGDIDV